jgi:hypothetical protein
MNEMLTKFREVLVGAWLHGKVEGMIEKRPPKNDPGIRNKFSSSATLSAACMITIATMAPPAYGELLVYEPFDYTPDEILTDKGGALGTVGTWFSNDTIAGDGKTKDWLVHAEGTTSGVGLSGKNPSSEPSGMHRWDGLVDNLATSGGFTGLWGADDWNDPDGPNSGEPGRNLDAHISLDPEVTETFQSGTTTWFSYVAVRGWDRNEETPNLIIGTDPTPNDSRAFSLSNSGDGIGTGGGPPRNNRGHIYPMYFSGGTAQNLLGEITSWTADEVTVPDDSRMDWQELDDDGFFGAVNIVVGKIQWDADDGGEDIISVARFLETETLSEEAFEAMIAAKPNLSSANWDDNKPDLDQSQFDILNIAGLKFFVDEIRIATTFDAVIGGGAAPPGISVVRNADGTVTVTFEGALQTAPTVNGPWQDVDEQSPYTLKPDQAMQFGRAVSE